MVLKSRSISSCVILQRLSARHWAVIGPCFFFVVRLASPRLVSPLSHWWALNPTSSIRARSLNSTRGSSRSEEHTSELQSPDHLVCRLLLEKKKRNHKSVPGTLIDSSLRHGRGHPH